jgi:hypothetical protein
VGKGFTVSVRVTKKTAFSRSTGSDTGKMYGKAWRQWEYAIIARLCRKMWYFVVFLKHFDLARMRLLKPWRNLGSPFATNQTGSATKAANFKANHATLSQLRPSHYRQVNQHRSFSLLLPTILYIIQPCTTIPLNRR